MLINRGIPSQVGRRYSDSEIEKWVEWQRSSRDCKTKNKHIEELDSWYIDSASGNIHHRSGRFFSIEGIRVNTTAGPRRLWDQPIINQPEVGFLGFLVTMIEGSLHFLVQAKVEPGNINGVQISPTLQATKSNFEKVHGGKRPKFLEFFRGHPECIVIYDQLQSEQGARFLRKRNRNMIVLCKDYKIIEEGDDFRWVSLAQLARMLDIDNLVNMDSRSIMSTFSRRDYEMILNQCGSGDSGYSSPQVPDIDGVLSWLSDLKSNICLEVRSVGLNEICEWSIIDGVLRRMDAKYFTVIGVGVEIKGREVESWDQPMVKPSQRGIIALIAKYCGSELKFLVQAKVESGNRDIIELAPTVQCLTGNHRPGKAEYKVPYLDFVLNCSEESILYDRFQSEEGGRFYREENRNMVILADEDFTIDSNSQMFYWMTLEQLLYLGRFNNFLNIAMRSILASIGW